jgi:hypothetical protein
MIFSHGEAVIRLRAKTKTDPYSQAESPDWSQDPDEVPIDGAFVAASSSVQSRQADRVQVITDKSLYCDPGADVVELDRIKAGGVTYSVTAVPSADVNPFTGWQPVQEIPLQEVRG